MRNLDTKYLLDYKNDQESSYWLFSILVDNVKEMQEYLKSKGIAASPVYSRNDRYKMTERFVDNNLTGVDYFSEHQISIPVGWWLSEADRELIVKSLNDYQGTQV